MKAYDKKSVERAVSFFMSFVKTRVPVAIAKYKNGYVLQTVDAVNEVREDCCFYYVDQTNIKAVSPFEIFELEFRKIEFDVNKEKD